jgi:predicted Zn-dependent protease
MIVLRPRIASLLKGLIAATALCAALTQPARAQSILRDAETETLFDQISAPMIRAAHLDPKNVKVVMINDNSINAFVAGGQVVYIHSGLIEAADNANEVQGVIAHELGHIAGGHVINPDGIKQATGITLLSLIVGAAAIAAGAGDLGAGVLAAGQQAAMGKYLAFTRVQEASADEAGSSYLIASGISGQGMLTFFRKLQGVEFRLAIPHDDGYGQTHPLTSDRIAILTDKVKAAPSFGAKTDPALEASFQRIKAKLKGFVAEPPLTLRDFPESNTSIPARYARAYAWHKSAYPEKALAEVDSLLTSIPGDPYFLELKGQILLESGRPVEALPILRAAVAKTNNQPLIASLFGHALIATEDQANYAEAEKVLKASINKDNENPFAWYQLGVIYDHKGDAARAAMASAERYHLEGRPRLALANADLAVRNLPTGTPDWIRAQDIAMVSRTAVDQEKHHKR